MSKLDEIRDSLIEIAGRLGTGLGLSPAAAQMYALLYLSDEQVSLDEMMAVLGVSKGNVSINIRVLERWGAVRKTWVRGERRDFYVANKDIAGIVVSRLREGFGQRLDEVTGTAGRLEETLKTMKNGLTPEEKKQARLYTQKLSSIKKTSVRLKKLLRLIPGGLV